MFSLNHTKCGITTRQDLNIFSRLSTVLMIKMIKKNKTDDKWRYIDVFLFFFLLTSSKVYRNPLGTVCLIATIYRYYLVFKRYSCSLLSRFPPIFPDFRKNMHQFNRTCYLMKFRLSKKKKKRHTCFAPWWVTVIGGKLGR